MKNDDCCTYECEQGKNCPIRQRAGQPADYRKWRDLVEPTPEQIREWERQDRSDSLSVAFLIGVIGMLIVVVLSVGVGA